MPPTQSAQERYETLRKSAWSEVYAGRPQAGLHLLETAIEVTQASGDALLKDTALCNLACLWIAIGRCEDALPVLRRILMQHQDSMSSFRAAYHLSRAHELKGDLKKAGFYARIAHRHSIELADPERMGYSYNQLGNLALAASNFEAALPQLEKALSLLPQTPSVERALILDNLGYCRGILGHQRRGFRNLFTSLRLLRLLGAEGFEANPRLSLAYAYLEIGRPVRAFRHAKRAFALADAQGDLDNQKYGLFLLGEAEKQRGNPLAARYYFHRLQENFYPDSPEVPDLLLFINVQQLVNLKA